MTSPLFVAYNSHFGFFLAQPEARRAGSLADIAPFPPELVPEVDHALRFSSYDSAHAAARASGFAGPWLVVTVEVAYSLSR